MQQGDRNTRFFHSTASQQRQKNAILGLQDELGNWMESEEDIERIVLDYYTTIYKSDVSSCFDVVIQAIEPKVTTEMNASLTREFHLDEGWTALQQMHLLKSPSPNVMPPIFYQKFLNIVGPNVTDCVLSILNSGTMPLDINSTHKCLIPKRNDPQKITDYRPISLSNVLSRIVSKVLANRLKKILPHIISMSQSAFLPDRLITNNVLVAFETMHCINLQRKGKEGLMEIKLDMSKAFDRVEWPCLERIMERLGFHDHWISLMMMCIKSVSYTVLLNGEPKGLIHSTRGIRQEDPISPYLFLLCGEGLSAMLKQEENRGCINGVSMCRRAPWISHLLFDDDSLIFYRANMTECSNIWKILREYEMASRQKMNKEKTSLFFNKNTTMETQDSIKRLFGAQIIKQHKQYLGLPSTTFITLQRKKESF